MRANSGRVLKIGLLLNGNLWAIWFRGVLAILFGAAVLIWPKTALLALLFLFACFITISGILLIVTAIRGRHFDQYWWLLLIEGILGVVLGCIAFSHPFEAALSIVILVAIWIIGTGVLQIITAIRLRKVIADEWILFLTGIGSVVVGLLLAIFPEVGTAVMISVIGLYAILLGIMLIALGFKLQRWHRFQSNAD